MSLESQHIEGAFTDGYWAVQVRLRNEHAGRRFLCHARNDREARRLADQLVGDSEDAQGFAYYRLRLPAEADRRAPSLGEHLEITSPNLWANLMATAIGYENLNRRAP